MLQDEKQQSSMMCIEIRFAKGFLQRTLVHNDSINRRIEQDSNHRESSCLVLIEIGIWCIVRGGREGYARKVVE